MKYTGLIGGQVFGFFILIAIEKTTLAILPILLIWIGSSIALWNGDKKIDQRNADREQHENTNKEQAIKEWEKEHKNNPPKYNFGE